MKEKNYKKCVICGKEYPCTPSRNVVTCSRECRLKYLSQNHKGLKMSAATREKMAESRKKVPNSAEIQRMATEAAKKSPKSGRFITNKAAIDWHLVSPEGEHFHIHSLVILVVYHSQHRCALVCPSPRPLAGSSSFPMKRAAKSAGRKRRNRSPP